MVQLTEVDDAMLKMDSPRTPQLISALAIYDASTSKTGDIDFPRIRETFARASTKSAIFRRKISDRSRGWDTPFWVEDKDFDLDFHLRHVALPEPGTWRQLCTLVGRLHANQVDRSRPLWEAYVIEGLDAIEGLPKGSFAIMLKMHHALADGVGVARLIELLNGTDPNDESFARLDAFDDYEGEEEPTTREVWSKGFANSTRRKRMLMENVRKHASKLMPSKDKGKKDKKADPDYVPTFFNDPVSSRRSVGAYTMMLDEMKSIRQAVTGVTLNDVAVAVVSGAMRKYLIDRGQEPQSSFVSAVPVSVREDFEGDILGNEIGSMLIRMGADVEDPIERLKVVHQSAEESKQRFAEMGKRLFLDISSSISPTVIGVGIRLMTLFINQSPYPANTIVSNVPGPREPRFMAGATLYSLHALGPLQNGLGVFHGLFSAAGRVPITFVACAEIVPDPEYYEDCLRQSWEELYDAARALPAAETTPGRPRDPSGAASNDEGRPTKRRAASGTSSGDAGAPRKRKAASGASSEDKGAPRKRRTATSASQGLK